MTAPDLLPIEFVAPLLTPSSAHGLYAATVFTDTTDPNAALRWLPSGVQIRVRNIGSGELASGVWEAAWCASPDDLTEDDLKTGTRPDDPDPFTATTVWTFDQTGDLRPPALDEVRERVRHTFALHEPGHVEREFATRLLADAGTPTPASALAEAVGALEEAFAATSTTGLIHARVGLLAIAEAGRLILRDPAAPGVLRTPAGHRWVFGGGYAAASLGDSLVATTPTFGWRGPIEVRETTKHAWNRFLAIAERSTLIGYEGIIGAAEVSTP